MANETSVKGYESMLEGTRVRDVEDDVYEYPSEGEGGNFLHFLHCSLLSIQFMEEA